jgi:hypothetical protein
VTSTWRSGSVDSLSLLLFFFAPKDIGGLLFFFSGSTYIHDFGARDGYTKRFLDGKSLHLLAKRLDIRRRCLVGGNLGRPAFGTCHFWSADRLGKVLVGFLRYL